MSKRMVVRLVIGIIGLVSGFLMILIPAVPGIISALVSSISCAWIAIVIATKGGTSIRDEMVMRVEHISGYYAFNATLWFIFVLVGLRAFSPFTFSIGDLLLALMLFMSLSFILIKYFLLRKGNAE